MNPWPFVISVTGVGATFTVGRKRWQGWVLGLLSDVIWFWYAFVSHSYGYALGAAGYAVVSATGLRHWLREPPK